MKILKSFAENTTSLFLMLPTDTAFLSIQKRFAALRARRKEISQRLELGVGSNQETEALRKEKYDIENTLKDALSDGEIYYKAGIVRNLDAILPELTDIDIPLFGTHPENFNLTLEEINFKYHTTYRATFGVHTGWQIAMASNVFPIPHPFKR